MTSESEAPRPGPIDRRSVLKLAAAAILAAPGLELLRALTGSESLAAAAAAPGVAAAAQVSASTPASPAVTLGGASVRPPSIPLAVRSPYLSAWLPATELTAATPRFWHGAIRGFVGLARIDGQLYAWAGQPSVNGATVTAMNPTATEITATRSIFTAQAGGVQLVAEWLSPVEPADLQWQSAPLTLLTVSISSTDGNAHEVQVYADITGEWASSEATTLIDWQTTADSSGRYWSVELQTPSALTETYQMANWGTVVWAAGSESSLSYQSGYSSDVRDQFASAGVLSDTSDPTPRAVGDRQPAFAFAIDTGSTGGAASAATSVSFALGHVRTPLISYGPSATQLVPWWTQYWLGWQPMTAAFLSGAASARQRALALDEQIEQAATQAGGSGYAAACALALRQCYGGTELAVGPDGSPWLLGKEISSDGDTNTVDIFDQAFLAWLWLDPDLIPLVMAPILDWCASPTWQDAAAWAGIPAWQSSQTRYCVHDIGVYPVASGRAPGAGEQMPVEESAGMLIMAAAYARAVGAAKAQPFLARWQTLWTQWAQYLVTQVPAPSTQLTTDDWAPVYRTPTGSVNLGIKAILGLAAAGQIATILGDNGNAASWSDAATSGAVQWAGLSTDSAAGNFLNLQQGATGTWTSVYNAYYEAVLGVSLVPQPVAAEQASFYLGKLGTYGLPLQTDAGDISKVAWQFYLAAWLNDYQVAEELISRSTAYLNETSSLVPYGDRFHTGTGVEVSGIQAHPTVGAVFAILAAGRQIAPQPVGSTGGTQSSPQSGGSPATQTSPQSGSSPATQTSPQSGSSPATQTSPQPAASTAGTGTSPAGPVSVAPNPPVRDPVTWTNPRRRHRKPKHHVHRSRHHRRRKHRRKP